MSNSQKTCTFTCGTVTVELGDDAVGNVVDYLPEAMDLEGFFQELAQSLSVIVRRAIACRNELTEMTVDFLAEGDDIEVLTNLLGTSAGMRYLSDERLKRMISTSDELAIKISEEAANFESANFSEICETLSLHTNPDVRLSVINIMDVPERILRMLSEDVDLNVAEQARTALEG
jgi:hypothetical protein